MVSVSLYDRTTIPTIRSVLPASQTDTDFSTTSGSYVNQGTQVLQAGETFFCSVRIRSVYSNSNSYAYIQVINGAGTVILNRSRYQSSHTTGHFTYKNETGSAETLTLQMKTSNGSYAAEGTWTRGLVMNDADLAKWEVVNLPTTRYRKYAVDKYYMLAKYTSGSFNIDGYQVNVYSGGIVEVPVETIVSSTALTGSGTHFFQVTGKGFTTTN